MRRAVSKAGVENFHVHDLRHTAATRLLRTTGNLVMSQKLLGHSQITTTTRYAHVTKDDLRQAMEDVENAKDSTKALADRTTKPRQRGSK